MFPEKLFTAEGRPVAEGPLAICPIPNGLDPRRRVLSGCGFAQAAGPACAGLLFGPALVGVPGLLCTSGCGIDFGAPSLRSREASCDRRWGGLPQLLALAGNAKSYAERLFDFPQIGPLDQKMRSLRSSNPLVT